MLSMLQAMIITVLINSFFGFWLFVYFFFDTLSCQNYFFRGYGGGLKIVVEFRRGWGGGVTLVIKNWKFQGGGGLT